MLVLVTEADPEEDCERGEEDEGGVEKDISGLGDDGVFESEEKRGKERSCRAAVEAAEC
jgi:hypothetical protein